MFELKSYKSLKRPGCPFQELAKEVLKKEKEQEKVLNAVSPTDTISDDGLDGEGKQRKPPIFIHVYRSLLTVPCPFSNQGLSRLTSLWCAILNYWTSPCDEKMRISPYFN